jgi:transposase, IS30 family
MKYNHLNHNDRYQISSLMKAGLNCTQITRNSWRCKSTISREIRRNKGGHEYRPKQADQLASERSLLSGNAWQIDPDVLKAAFERFAEQLSPEKVAAEMPISHETLYQHIYPDEAARGALWKNLRC